MLPTTTPARVPRRSDLSRARLPLLALRLREWRSTEGLSLEEAAARVGVSVSLLSLLERGLRGRPRYGSEYLTRPATVAKLESVLGEPVRPLLRETVGRVRCPCGRGWVRYPIGSRAAVPA